MMETAELTYKPRGEELGMVKEKNLRKNSSMSEKWSHIKRLEYYLVQEVRGKIFEDWKTREGCGDSTSASGIGSRRVLL